MQTKQSRHDRILEIIQKNNIETQEQLLEKLKAEGFDITQATISRDIRELKLFKVSCGLSMYKYASALSPQNQSAKFYNIMRETVTHVDYANNLVVIKTYSGMAQAAAAALDNMGWTEIVGSIAGDDTLLLVMRSNESASNFLAEFQAVLDK